MSARIRPGRCVGELHRLLARAGDAGHVVPELLDERFEVHGDERLVLDDEDVGRHVGGELAARLLDELAHHRDVDAQDRGRLLLGEALEARQQEGLARQGGDLAEADLGRQVALDLSLLPLTDREFQMRVKTRNRSTFTLLAWPIVSGSFTSVSRVAAT